MADQTSPSRTRAPAHQAWARDLMRRDGVRTRRRAGWRRRHQQQRVVTRWAVSTIIGGTIIVSAALIVRAVFRL